MSEAPSGIWTFRNGVTRLVEAPAASGGAGNVLKVLVHVPNDTVIASYDVLSEKLLELGWERYYDDPDLLQFHKRATVNLISLPKDFAKLKSVHMYDVVVKNRDAFIVRG